MNIQHPTLNIQGSTENPLRIMLSAERHLVWDENGVLFNEKVLAII